MPKLKYSSPNGSWLPCQLAPMEFHAWFEAFVSGRWHIFDATQKSKQGGYVTIGYGPDTADVAIYN